MSDQARAMPAQITFLLTMASFLGAFLVTFASAQADDRGEGNYYYDRYALPWVKAYAPPDTAPGTYGRADDGEYPRGSRNHY